MSNDADQTAAHTTPGNTGGHLQPDILDDGKAADDPRISAIEAELASMRDLWMRSEAEIANVRKRAKRDVDEARLYALQKFAGDIVQVADDLKRGIDSIPIVSATDSPIVSKLRDGFLSVERNFTGLLKRNGIVKDDPTGTAFDPQRHQAMSESVSNECQPGTVLKALSDSWTLNGRLLRPAMVVVAKAAE
jgi:molecular chaperone GrpE